MKLSIRVFMLFVSMFALSGVAFAESYNDYKSKIGGHLWDSQRGSVKSIHRASDEPVATSSYNFV